MERDLGELSEELGFELTTHGGRSASGAIASQVRLDAVRRFGADGSFTLEQPSFEIGLNVKKLMNLLKPGSEGEAALQKLLGKLTERATALLTQANRGDLRGRFSTEGVRAQLEAGLRALQARSGALFGGEGIRDQSQMGLLGIKYTSGDMGRVAVRHDANRRRLASGDTGSRRLLGAPPGSQRRRGSGQPACRHRLQQLPAGRGHGAGPDHPEHDSGQRHGDPRPRPWCGLFACRPARGRPGQDYGRGPRGRHEGGIPGSAGRHQSECPPGGPGPGDPADDRAPQHGSAGQGPGTGPDRRDRYRQDGDRRPGGVGPADGRLPDDGRQQRELPTTPCPSRISAAHIRQRAFYRTDNKVLMDFRLERDPTTGKLAIQNPLDNEETTTTVRARASSAAMREFRAQTTVPATLAAHHSTHGDVYAAEDGSGGHRPVMAFKTQYKDLQAVIGPSGTPTARAAYIDRLITGMRTHVLPKVREQGFLGQFDEAQMRAALTEALDHLSQRSRELTGTPRRAFKMGYMGFELSVEPHKVGRGFKAHLSFQAMNDPIQRQFWNLAVPPASTVTATPSTVTATPSSPIVVPTSPPPYHRPSVKECPCACNWHTPRSFNTSRPATSRNVSAFGETTVDAAGQPLALPGLELRLERDAQGTLEAVLLEVAPLPAPLMPAVSQAVAMPAGTEHQAANLLLRLRQDVLAHAVLPQLAKVRELPDLLGLKDRGQPVGVLPADELRARRLLGPRSRPTKKPPIPEGTGGFWPFD